VVEECSSLSRGLHPWGAKMSRSSWRRHGIIVIVPQLVPAGANVKAVQKMLGHASAAMTLDVYADLFDDDLEAVATALDQARTRSCVADL
jgi:integrase